MKKAVIEKTKRFSDVMTILLMVIVFRKEGPKYALDSDDHTNRAKLLTIIPIATVATIMLNKGAFLLVKNHRGLEITYPIRTPPIIAKG